MANEPASTDAGRLVEERFAAAYASIDCKGAKEAAELVGLSPSYGKKILQRPRVKQLIADHVAWQVRQAGVNNLRVLTEALYVARSDMFEIIKISEGKAFFRDPRELPDHVGKAIRKITCKTETEEKSSDKGGYSSKTKLEIGVELHAKDGTLNLLAKHLGLLDKKEEDKDSFAEAMMKAWAELSGGDGGGVP